MTPSTEGTAPEPRERGTRASLSALEPGRALLLLAGAITVWWFLFPVYDRVLAVFAGSVLDAIDTGEATFLKEIGDGDWIAYSRRLSPARTDFPAISVREIHAPVVLLPLLVGWLPRRLGWPPCPKIRFVLPLLLLLACQSLALVAWAQQVVGTSYGSEGARLFSDVGRNAWAGATIAWRVGGRFAVVILAWSWAYRNELLGADQPSAGRTRETPSSRKASRSPR